MSRKKLLILIIICIVIIISVIISVPLIIDSQKTATLNLFVVPEQSKILINGEEYKNGNYKFFPGEVEISISKEGFKTKNLKTNLEANKTTLIYKLLDCSDSTLYCYLNNKNESDYNLLPFIVNYSDNKKETENFIKKASIKQYLPIIYTSSDDNNSKIYSFNVSMNNDLSLNVEDFIGNYNEILPNLLQSSGFNIDDYKINIISNIKTGKGL